MKFKKNKTYRLFEYEPYCGMLYLKVTDGLIHFYHCYDYWGDRKGEMLWIESGFLDCKLIFRSEEYGSGKDYGYMLLKKAMERLALWKW